MYILTGDECNCSCRYCLGRMNPEVYGGKISNEDYYQRLSNTLKSLDNNVRSLIIFGGEPTISPRIFGILDVIKGHNSRKVMITNAIKLKDNSFLRRINKSDLDIMCISRHDTNEEGNRYLFRNNNIPDKEELKVITENLKSNPGFTCNLIKDHIDNLGKVKAYLSQAKEIGINNISFLELATIDKDFPVRNEVIKYCDETRVSINGIVEQMKKDKSFVLINEEARRGSNQKLFDFTYGDANVQMRTVNTVFEEKKLEEDKNILYSLKFHPKGVLSASWDPRKFVLS